MTVPAPVEQYDRLHQELLRTTGTRVQGLLVHLGRRVEDGFQVLEVWDDKEHCDRYNREVVWPLMAQVFQDHPPAGEPVMEEFDVRGLVVPTGGVTI